MPNREAMRLRRLDGGSELRPIDIDDFNSALRSDFEYKPPTADYSETYMRVRPVGYGDAIINFLPDDIPADLTYGLWNCLTVVRSPAGTPVTNLDGTEIVRYDYTKTVRVTTRALTSNVVTLTTLTPHAFTVGEKVIIRNIGSPFDGVYTVASTPTATTFTYAKTNANVATGSATGYATEVNTMQPIPDGRGAVINDSGMLPGRWYYYALFARYQNEGVTLWQRVAVSDLLVPVDFGHRDKLWGMIPEYYRRLDNDQSGSYERGLLRRYLDVMGYELDIQRTFSLTIGDVWDAERVSSRILPHLGRALGLPYEGAIGDKRFRSLINNIMYLRKIKGSIDGIEGYMSALTGYRTLAYAGLNMLLDNNSAESRYSIGDWETAITDQNLARVVSAGETDGPANGVPYLRLTNATGGSATATLRLGTTGGVFTRTKAIPVIAGHQYGFSALFKHSEAAKSVTIALDWYDVNGTFLSTTSKGPLALAGAGAWTTERIGTAAANWMTAPANARYVAIRLTVASTANAATLAMWRAQLVDRAWRPGGVAAKQDIEPLSSTAIDTDNTYADEQYYESSRKVYVNFYPQRTNFATNTDFSIDGVGWNASEPTTYELLRKTYETYADIVAEESSYEDLQREFDPIASNTVITFDPLNNELIVHNDAGAPPHLSQFTSDFFPVNGLTPFSASILARSTHADTIVRLRFKWFSDDLVTEEVFETDDTGRSVVRTSEAFRMGEPGGSFYLADEQGNLVLDQLGRPILLNNTIASLAAPTVSLCSISNIMPPPTARFGRLVVETYNNTAEHIERFSQPLIEDAPIPGPYFNGYNTEGAPGDFAFNQDPGYGFSMYYMNYQVMLSGTGNRVGAVLPTLIPPGRDFAIVTAYTTSGVSQSGLF